MKFQKTLSLLLLLSLLLTLAACGGTTQPTTDPTVTTTAPTQPKETEPATEPPTEPEETEPQLQFQHLEPEGAPLTYAQLQDIFSFITESDQEHWYETIFIQDFTGPEEINYHLLFSDGIPAERASADLTEAEKNFFIQNGDESVLHFDIDRIPRETVEYVLCTYFDLTAGDLEQMDMENLPGVPYFPKTGCYYGTNNSYNGDTPHFLEGYRLEDGSLAIYFYRYKTRVSEGTLCRALIRLEEEAGTYKVLQITKVEP